MSHVNYTNKPEVRFCGCRTDMLESIWYRQLDVCIKKNCWPILTLATKVTSMRPLHWFSGFSIKGRRERALQMLLVDPFNKKKTPKKFTLVANDNTCCNDQLPELQPTKCLPSFHLRLCSLPPQCRAAVRTWTNLDRAITAAHDNKWRWQRTTALSCLPGHAFMPARTANW